MPSILNKDEFVKRSIIKHGNVYDYSKVRYVNSYTKVTITCSIHGDFSQRPSGHMSGMGCPSCGSLRGGSLRVSSTEEFVSKAKAIHGDRYDYGKVRYLGVRTKVTITCRIHGDFEQTPELHLSGGGCKQCVFDAFKNKRKHGTAEFVSKAKAIHGDRYDYGKVRYGDNNEDKVTITCRIHGDFEQTPAAHLAKKGCRVCGNDLNKLNTHEFIQKAELIHNGKYNYDKSVYTGSRFHLVITCPTHGDFLQKANSHLNGNGCPRCASSKGEERIEKILDSNNISFKKQYNITETDTLYRYDFYLPDHNLLIEFHGVQHYKRINYFHKTENDFLMQKLRDQTKVKIAKAWGYKLLILNYIHLKGNLINTILLDYLKLQTN